MILHKDDPRYKVNTQSELIDLYNQKNSLKEQADAINKEYNRLHKEVLGSLQEEYTKVSNYLDCVREVTELYHGKPIHEGWSIMFDGVYSVSEIMAEHHRHATWYDDVMFDDKWKTGIFYDGDWVWDKDQCTSEPDEVLIVYSLEEFKKHAKDWVVLGKLPDLNGDIA